MTLNNLLLVIGFYLTSLAQVASAQQQSGSSSIAIKKIAEENFSFTKKWDYPFGIVKLENGKFLKDTDGKLIASDTAHLHYTANCQNNVQGPNTINYCEAVRGKQGLRLVFRGSLPAYGSEFEQQIKDGKLTFTPGIVYPEHIEGQNIKYRVVSNVLYFNKSDYINAKEVSGYTNTLFEEIVILPGKKPVINQYYLHGYFKALVKAE